MQSRRETRFIPITNAVEPLVNVQRPIPKVPDKIKTVVQWQPDTGPPFDLRHKANETPKIDGKSYHEHYRIAFHITLGRNKGVIAAYRVIDPTGTGHRSALLVNVCGSDSRNEIGIAQSIRHDNFVKPIATYGTGNDLMVAYEFVPLSLSEVIANRSLVATELASIIRQVSIYQKISTRAW
ncbi:hypothetical protein FSARC_7382 [Fusarium sarcochroum]|uniref:Protein kinase domain-containing protein n=1 Tax=Fusarium sarcochroum TaxID=1208366 RepID=A0A8H4TVB7_9HYPO|nr:hypothetical protein FSARC_7382 [Fusarium sarcochroum]